MDAIECRSPARSTAVRRPVRPRPVSIRAGEVAIPCLLALAAVLGVCCLATLASSPPAFRRCGAAIDRLLDDTVDAWLGVDTLTVPWLRVANLPWGDVFTRHGVSDLALPRLVEGRAAVGGDRRSRPEPGERGREPRGPFGDDVEAAGGDRGRVDEVAADAHAMGAGGEPAAEVVGVE